MQPLNLSSSTVIQGEVGIDLVIEPREGSGLYEAWHGGQVDGMLSHLRLQQLHDRSVRVPSAGQADRSPAKGASASRRLH